MHDKQQELLEKLNELEGKMIDIDEISGSINPFRIDQSEHENLEINYIKETIEHILNKSLSSSDHLFISNIYNENRTEINTIVDLLKLMQLQDVKSLSEQKMVKSLTKFIEDFS
ncbi:hypothetical protein PaeCFBP13512_18515 [Paenibacillus sp. CFBP13512]|uniref:hypothetical protein n=1 Tax=Paenibacillus sp. CFBP13512 TaxID=2184007 RepID=UPI0010C0EB82|nr:hypothetical protein [Paenibacillus sp. CFBP13512]TKJ87217.1 hypothetical protein PaeCFBP13512_18515 [Paenibacillus sp. CFBP13512]